MDKYEFYEKYADYEYIDNSRSARRCRGSRNNNQPDETHDADILAMDDGIETWAPSYAAALDPLHHERQWVIESVSHFYRQNIITDLTRLVKGGKEANVYVCTAHPATGMTHLAAKLYRERMLRHLKNDAIYKIGRTLRDAEGKQIRSRRERTAVLKKTGYGQHLDFMMWIGTEYRTQSLLYDAGADVPKPIGHSGNTILMEYIGDAYNPAPTLSEINIPVDEAQSLFDQVMRNVALFLDHHLIHGDLSAYNILYWEGEIRIIDFPQMVEARQNPHAFDLLQRDITRVCDYFTPFGVEADPVQFSLDLWEPYMGRPW